MRDRLFDQTAFYETVLELLEVERANENRLDIHPSIQSFFVSENRPESERELKVKPDRNRYRSDCMKLAFNAPNAPGRLVQQTYCFFAWLRELAGPPGARNSELIGFLDPRIMHVNNVRLNISTHIVEDALFFHFAGREHKLKEIRDTVAHLTNLTCPQLIARPGSAQCRVNNQGAPVPRLYCPFNWAIC